MPPTTGHLQLIQFANHIAPDGVIVIACTQPFEPMAYERISALRKAITHHHLENVTLIHLNRIIEQNPKTLGFWEMWRDLLVQHGVTPSDFIVASEPYGQRLAEIAGAQFFPYDIDRSINHAKATPIRDHTLSHFHDILPEFRSELATTVTVFGAESTGKTTLSRQLAKKLKAHWLFEYARPYLEHTINEITTRSMRAIWRGQAALQLHTHNYLDSPYVIQDTDLFSTVGYWQLPHWQQELGKCPEDLVKQALALRSDLYIITKSNIPFEKDPLRYGGNKREGSDEYWIDICNKYELPYVILSSSDPNKRLKEALKAIKLVANKKVERIAYDRRGL